MKTVAAKNEDIKRDWFIIDAACAPLGRVVTKVASLLMGKGKPIYTPNVDCGDYVIVVNADNVVLTGKKLTDKKYYRHSGYPGGIKERSASEQIKKDSRKVFEHAVKGMLPKSALGRNMFKKLFVYKDENHKHQAQKPTKIGV